VISFVLSQWSKEAVAKQSDLARRLNS